MYGRLLCGLVAILLVLMILTPIAGPVINIVKAEAVGYLAVKDYLGTTWTLEDVEKIINTTIQTVDGELKSLADYFWIVVDDDPENNKYNLRDFIRSPLDNTTAVLPLTPGDHYIDIYWFGYHQRQLVNIIENAHYVLNLETAPVMPFSTAGEPPSSSYEWDLASNPDGLTIQRRDGNAWIRFNYNQTYITVGWYDEDLAGWNYNTLDIDINSGYDWRFHITDPSNPTYTEEGTGSFLWFTWDVYKVAETIKYNRTGEILHLVYTVVVAENQALFNAVDEFWNGVSKQILAFADPYIDPVTKTIYAVESFTSYIQSAYDTWMGELYASKYQKTIVLIWDVFCTPTQIVILAHAYDVDTAGTLTPRSITSQNAFVLNNRLVYEKLLHGGWGLTYIDTDALSISGSGQKKTYYVKSGNDRVVSGDTIYYPVATTVYLDSLDRYILRFWIDTKMERITGRYNYVYHIDIKLYLKLNITVESVKADTFENILIADGYTYTRNGNTFIITIYYDEIVQDGSSTNTIISKTFRVVKDTYIEFNGKANVTFILYVSSYGYSDYTSATQKLTVHYLKALIGVEPALIPPQISLLKDGYYKVNNVFGVQVFTDLYRSDNESYVLGYYILDNEPPPSYIIRDVYYDVENDLMHYVYTIISADCYGQDIVNIDNVNYTTSLYEYQFTISPTVRLFNNVTLAMFSFNRMSFLNLAPEVIEYLLAIPPNQGGWGTPIIDWSTVSIITLNFSRPYELYYYNKENDEWIRVKPVYYNDTKIYDIVRYSDNVLIEKLNVSEISQYYYKLIYTDTNETYKGWLWNDNGTLKMITGQVTWSLTNAELQQLLAMVQLEGIIDQWQKQWEKIARMMGLISEAVGSAVNWFNSNWIYLLLGFFGVMFMILLIFALASRPRITVAVPRKIK